MSLQRRADMTLLKPSFAWCTPYQLDESIFQLRGVRLPLLLLYCLRYTFLRLKHHYTKGHLPAQLRSYGMLFPKALEARIFF